jgi:hypothetical protein
MINWGYFQFLKFFFIAVHRGASLRLQDDANSCDGQCEAAAAMERLSLVQVVYRDCRVYCDFCCMCLAFVS